MMRMNLWEIKPDMFSGFAWEKKSQLDHFFTVTCLENGITKRVWPRTIKEEGYSIDDVTHIEYCGGWPVRTLTLFSNEQTVMDYIRRMKV